MTLTLSTFAAIGFSDVSSSAKTMIEPFFGPVYFGHVRPVLASTGFRVLFAARESQNAIPDQQVNLRDRVKGGW